MPGIWTKLNHKTQTPVYVLNAPAAFASALEEAPTEVKTKMGKNVSFLVAFATQQAQVDKLAAQCEATASGDAVIWVAYPKKSSKNYACEFNRDNGWAAWGAAGFEPVRQVAIDEDWSALRFRRVEFIQTMTRSFAMTEEGKRKSAKSATKP
ncbi:MAG: hypothetical protein NW208_01660 [Bryobacter sp.]|nr:hypothetical protein [Bryobacter sp.]